MVWGQGSGRGTDKKVARLEIAVDHEVVVARSHAREQHLEVGLPRSRIAAQSAMQRTWKAVLHTACGLPRGYPSCHEGGVDTRAGERRREG